MSRQNFLRFLVSVSVVLGLFVVLSLVLGMPGQAQDVHTQDATVTLDGPVFTSTLGYNGGSTIGITCSTGTGSNRLMLVSVYWQCVAQTPLVNILGVTLTYGSGITRPLSIVEYVDNYTRTIGFGRRQAIYSLVNPPYNASGYVTVTFSGVVQYGIVAGVANFSGVNQSAPLGTVVTATVTDTLANGTTDLFVTRPLTVTTTPGDLVYDSVGLYSAPPVGFITATVDQTELWSVLRARTQIRVRGAAGIKSAVGATTVVSWTSSGIPGAAQDGTYYRAWARIAVPIKVTPTAARLNSFTAGANLSGVRVAWETATDFDTIGFHVYRATSVNGQRKCLTTGLIPSQAPGSPSGSRYQFVDETAQPGLTYYYWIELVGVDGGIELDGPVSGRVNFNLKLPPPRE